MKDKEYLYTVDVRAGKDGAGVVQWARREVMATSIYEVARLLKKKIDDVRYVKKQRLRGA